MPGWPADGRVSRPVYVDGEFRAVSIEPKLARGRQIEFGDRAAIQVSAVRTLQVADSPAPVFEAYFEMPATDAGIVELQINVWISTYSETI